MPKLMDTYNKALSGQMESQILNDKYGMTNME
jgi:hypothetical protein